MSQAAPKEETSIPPDDAPLTDKPQPNAAQKTPAAPEAQPPSVPEGEKLRGESAEDGQTPDGSDDELLEPEDGSDLVTGGAVRDGCMSEKSPHPDSLL